MNRSFLRTCFVMFVGTAALALSPGCNKKDRGPVPESRTAPPATRIVVEAVYPGASAGVVAETVAAPIEQQVNGIEGLLHQRSRCSDDGRYVLTLSFRPRTDLNAAIAQVQKRVALAQPTLPDEVVRRQGVLVKRQGVGPVMLLRLFAAPERKTAPTGAAALQVRDALLRLPGVGDVVHFGPTDQSVRVWLNPDQLAAKGLTVNDVVRAIESQNLPVVVGQKPVPPSQPIRLTLDVLKRPADVKLIGQVIVKATSEGRVIRLEDVARIALATDGGAAAHFNGKPSVIVAVHPQPGADLTTLSRTLTDGLAKVREASVRAAHAARPQAERSKRTRARMCRS